VIQTQKVTTPTDNLETGQPFKQYSKKSVTNLLLKVSGGAVLSEKK
jgi:hypothetical protein